MRGEAIEDFLDDVLGGAVLAGLDELVVSVIAAVEAGIAKATSP